MNIVEIKNLSFRYDGFERFVLKNIDLDIEQGDFVAVVGHNGSGKSTLALILNGIFTPTEGSVKICGTSTESDDMEKIKEIRGKLGTVFQNPDNQIIASIVEEDVAFALENLGVKPDEMRRRVDEALDSVGMREYAKHATYKLSGGQKQRVAIAGILAMRPEVIVLDEPTAMLDPQGRKEVMGVLKKLNESGTTVIIITHFMDEAAQAKRVVVVNEGEILIDGTPQYVFQNGGLLRSVGLDVPQSTELMFCLRRNGFRVPLAILTENECADVLEKVLTGGIEASNE